MYLSIVSSLAPCIVGAVVENRPGKVGVEVPMAMTAVGARGEGGCHRCGRVSAVELRRDPTALRRGSGQR